MLSTNITLLKVRVMIPVFISSSKVFRTGSVVSGLKSFPEIAKELFERISKALLSLVSLTSLDVTEI